MLSVLVWEAKIFEPSVVHTLTMTVTGAMIYFVALLLMRDQFLLKYVKVLFNKIKR